MNYDSVKCVVVGDGAVGKSCLLISYTSGNFPQEYVPTVFDNYSGNIMFDGRPYLLELWDTAGQEDYDRLRPLSYRDTDIFLLCYSVVSKASFNNLKHKWIPEIRHHQPNTSILLVGCKSDLLRDHPRAVSEGEARALVRECALQSQVVCSALTGDNVTLVFEEATRLGASRPSKSGRKSFSLFSRSAKQDPNPKPQPPPLPKSTHAPWIDIAPRTLGRDWARLVNSPRLSDVEFRFEGGKSLRAHRLILCQSCVVFRSIFGIGVDLQYLTLDQAYGVQLPRWSAEEATAVPCILACEETTPLDAGATHFAIDIQNFKEDVFHELLHFLYTGDLKLKSNAMCAQLITLATQFRLPALETYCHNMQNGLHELNPSVSSWLVESRAAICGKLFLRSDALADGRVAVGGETFPIHRLVCEARNDVLTTMMDYASKDSRAVKILDADVDTFHVLLDFIYTGMPNIRNGDWDSLLAILQLADKFRAPRLITYCEYLFTKVVERECEESIEKANVDVIGLLKIADKVDAKQLSSWCLHFISSNYAPMSKRAEFGGLEGSNLAHIEKHQWPPKSYYKQLADYEGRLREWEKKTGKNDNCVVS